MTREQEPILSYSIFTCNSQVLSALKRPAATTAHLRVFLEETQHARQHGYHEEDLHQPVLELLKDHAEQRLSGSHGESKKCTAHHRNQHRG